MNKNIVYKALEALKQAVDIPAEFREESPLDGSLEIELNDKNYRFRIEIRQELRAYQVEQIERSFNNYDNYLLIASRIFPKIKEKLRAKGIPYLEANGNIFLKRKGLFLFIDTQNTLSIKKTTGNRAFTQTGLKVLFYLLQHKEAINLPQREIADLTNVALGNIPQIIKGLKETGYLIPLNNNTYIWENRKELLNRWITEYEIRLRPKLVKARYTLNTLNENWNEVALRNGTVWGGEPAADIITNHLRPEKFLLYTNESHIDLIRNYKFMPDKNGELEVLERFWGNTVEKTAPKLLVYADLILQGGKRNKETAEKIYNEYIEPNL